jgi:hypothetical protein
MMLIYLIALIFNHGNQRKSGESVVRDSEKTETPPALPMLRKTTGV